MAATVLAVVAVVLAPINIWLSTQVQAEGQAMNQRRNFIAQTAQLSRVAEVTATTLARYAVRDNDANTKALLTRAGITIQTAPPSQGAAPAAPPSGVLAPPPGNSLLPTPPVPGRAP